MPMRLDKQHQPACTYPKEFHRSLASIDKLGSNQFCKCARQSGRLAPTREAKPTAIAFPIRLAPPVTSAVFPANSNILSQRFILCSDSSLVHGFLSLKKRRIFNAGHTRRVLRVGVRVHFNLFRKPFYSYFYACRSLCFDLFESF
jgi:hypothetical protein